MVALLALSGSPISSSSSLALFPNATPIKFSDPSYATFHGHEWFSLQSCSSISRFVLKPLLSYVGYRSTEQFPVQCNCIGALADIDTQSQRAMLLQFFQEVGIDENDIQGLLDKNAVLMFASLDSIRSRIHSLQSVRIDGLALCRLIRKCPNVLTSDEIDSLICFVVDDLGGNVEPTQLNRLLTATEPRFLLGFDKKVRLLLDHGVPQDKIVHVLNNVNLAKALCLKSVEEIDKTLNFLKRFGGIELIVRRPMILNYDLDTQLIPRIEFLLDLSGGNEEATGIVLRKLSAIVSYSVQHVESHVEFLRSFAGLSDEEIFKIILGYPNVISASRERKLRPRIEFLKQCGLDSEGIFKFLIKAPLFLGLSFVDNLAYKLVFLVKIGYRYRTKELAVAMGSVTRTSCENLQKVIGVFLCYGFSFADIMAMSRKQPQILQYTHTSLKEKMDYLVDEMGRDVTELLTFPAFLGYKLDDRIKLRFEVKRRTIGERMSLNKLLTVSHERFSKKEEGGSTYD